MQKKLTTADKAIIKKRLYQITLRYILVLFAVTLLVFVVNHVLSVFTDNVLWHVGISASMLFIVLVFFSLSVKEYVKDLRDGNKLMFLGMVTGKYDDTKYGWTGNPGADMATQPILKEYWLEVDGKQAFTNKEDYYKYEIGDKVIIYTTLYSQIILSIDNEV